MQVSKTAIMNGETTTVSAYFPLPGGATYYQTGSTGANQYFWHKDWLGSARLSSSITNRTTYFDRGFAPFGESYSNFGNAAGLDFTGDTQDSFAGLLYDTPGRELHPGQGRWLSPDPAGIGVVDPTSPQSWNRYAFVNNSPLNSIDPSGMACYPLERQIFGSCAGFMDNGVDFGGNWNEFAVMSIPAITPNSAYNPPSYWMYTTITFDSEGNQIGDPFYTFGVQTGGWQNLGNGLDALNIIAANNTTNCQAPFLCNPVGQIGPPQQYKPPPSSYLSKYGAQLACEASVGIALVSDQQEQIFGAAFGLLAGYYKGNVIAATGGLMLAANVTVGNALRARSTCVPLAWGPGYY